MGVQGLWQLLQPCARPTKLESLEGKRLAIDSSIWLYHFQMAMRDKEGRTLANAHILGFLWRILKLIHYGVRPIFVFDGGAPVLKRKTLVGRRTRKTGARDDHRRVAERLLHARMREAALAHVNANNGASTSNSGGAAIAEGEHGLGENVVYMDDLAGATGASAAATESLQTRRADAIDDGSITTLTAQERQKEIEAERKRKRDQWQKDPYALPALEQDISTMTAETSTAARKARGGGKKGDIRFATEGELRTLLSSIQPTDLDLDSDFFRSLPTEMQYELVGDLRAASRGTSYKRLQAMLASSPTPIDFSRAQIAGLKTRNELTQKVLEVTDEIGDAHIKVPVRVAGARNREYVLIKKKGNEAGFVLGIRDTGTTVEKPIHIEEDSASATTAEDEYDRRHTDEEIDLEDVPVEQIVSPSKPVDVPDALLRANVNDPLARRNVARELLQRRALQLAKEKRKEQGIVDEGELMEEALSKMRSPRKPRGTGRGARRGSRGRKANLFRQADGREINLERIGAHHIDDDEDEEVLSADASSDDSDEHESDIELELDEAEDLTRAIHESEQAKVGSDEEMLELDEVDINGVAANDYAQFYSKAEGSTPAKEIQRKNDEPAWVSPSRRSVKPSKPSPTKPQSVSRAVRPKTPSPPHSPIPTTSTGVPSLGFRLSDRNGYPERLDPDLRSKFRIEDRKSDDEDAAVAQSTSAPVKAPPSTISISDSSDIVSELDKAVTGPSDEASARPKVTDVLPHKGQDSTVKAVDFVDRPAEKVESIRQGREKEGEEAEDTGGTTTEIDASEASQKSSPSLTKNASAPSHVAPTSTEADQGAISVSSGSPAPSSNILSPPWVSPRVPRKSDATPSAQAKSDGKMAEQAIARRSPSPPRTSPSPEPASMPGSPELVLRHASPGLSDSRIMADDTADMDMAEPNDPEFDNLISMAEEEGEFDEMRVDEGAPRDASPPPVYSPDWSRSPTPADEEEEIVLGPDGFPLPTAAELEAMEAEDEAELGQMDGDQDEFVSFLSRAKGRGLHEVRKEVEEEVNRLRSEHAATRRNEGDVTQQMAKEIQLMLRLFGLPYITAPMEAEAQCAELVTIGLADGIITDDSDVFLFGGTFIYKNMFNNKKYVECYKLSDLQHDLGMDRTKLVQLAYLLGSDYTDGLEGVGPVLAMEILGNFVGDDGLIQFRQWWLKVQTGTDTPRDTCNKTLKRVKRTLRNKIHLDDRWPDVNVLDAYYEPTVDSSEEPFQWGLPDLDSLRSFFHEYLRWDREKTDQYLIPAIEEQNRRNRRTQSTLDNGNFFDLSNGAGAYAGRQRPGYQSSRLQEVIANFRTSKRAADARLQEAGEGATPVIALSDDDGEGEQPAQQAADRVPERVLGKEMGKRSRPIVTKSGAGASAAKASVPQEETTPRDSTSAKRGRGGAATKATRGKRKGASNSPAQRRNDGPQLEDEEWRPRKAPQKRRKTGPKEGETGKTTLAQARNMILDHIDSLPPSRARPEMRSRMSASSSREDLFRGNDNDDQDSSGLSELE